MDPGTVAVRVPEENPGQRDLRPGEERDGDEDRGRRPTAHGSGDPRQPGAAHRGTDGEQWKERHVVAKARHPGRDVQEPDPAEDGEAPRERAERRASLVPRPGDETP